ncbi:MAG: phenylacetate--CoA ligase family protein [Candidatus Dormibacterales bacterium]
MTSTMFQPELEAMDSERLGELQGGRLAALVGRLKNSGSPYWKAKLVGLEPESIRTIDDLRRLPFTTKSELRDSFPFGMLAVPLADTVRVHASSGTRGKPTIVAYTMADIDLFADVNARAIAAAGGRKQDVLHVAYGYGLFTGGLGLHYGGERLGATVVPASAGNPGLQVQLMADLGANGLACTPSFALLLAERAEADGLKDRIRKNLRYGVFGAEPWSEAFRSKLEQAWDGLKAHDLYGLSEVIGPGVAAECCEGRGSLHVFEDHFYPELVDERGEPVPTGLPGELVLTTLTKEAMPVIRYRTGDITSFVAGPCGCGRTSRRITRFAGRVDDMLVIRGINVYPSEIEAVLLDDPRVSGQYQIILDRRDALPELVVRPELARPVGPDERAELVGSLVRALKERLRLRVGVLLGDPGSLLRQETGKAKRVWEVTSAADPLAALLVGSGSGNKG